MSTNSDSITNQGIADEFLRMSEPSALPPKIKYARLDLSNLDNIPIELSAYNSWVCWREDPPRNPLAKPVKMPIAPRTGRNGSVREPKGWTSRETAVNAYTKNNALTGIGFVFSEADPYVGIDLDKCRNPETREIENWASELVRLIDSYSEISPSQTGIKILVRGSLAGKENHFVFGGHEAEIYESGRYFALTGRRLPETPTEIHERQDKIDLLVPNEPPQIEPSETAIPRAEDEAAKSVDAIPDEELIGRVERSAQGKKFKQLMAGSTAGYAGYFASSGALCSILAAWTRCNAERIDRIYRRSGLFEESWWDDYCYSGRRSRATVTIANACALAATGWMYSPKAKPPCASGTFVESGTSPTPTRPGEAPQTEINKPTIATVGTKDMPESVLDGWLGQICKSRMLEHFPVAYAWTALVTVASAMVPGDPTKNGMRCNLFGCPVGPIHSGKSEAIKHAKLLLGIQSPPLLDLFAGSAEMLTSAVADANGRPRLYSTDELGHLLEKAQIQNSSFVYLLNRAFYETGFTVRSMEKKKKEVVFNAILSVIGGVVEERFGDLFTAKTTGGFYDRFLYGLCPTGFRYFYMPFEGGPALQISRTEADPYSEANLPIASVCDQPIPVALDKSVFVEANRWMRDDDVLKNPDCERIVEIAMRVATICASFDRRPILYGNDLGPALELARYQARIRHLLKPNPGKTFEGQLYHKFFEFLTMHTSDGCWMPRKELFHRTCSHEIGLPVANKTLDAMIANEDVEGLEQPGKSGPPKRLVRIARKTKVQI